MPQVGAKKLTRSFFGALFDKITLFSFNIPVVVASFAQKISLKCKSGGCRSESELINHYRKKCCWSKAVAEKLLCAGSPGSEQQAGSASGLSAVAVGTKCPHCTIHSWLPHSPHCQKVKKKWVRWNANSVPEHSFPQSINSELKKSNEIFVFQMPRVCLSIYLDLKSGIVVVFLRPVFHMAKNTWRPWIVLSYLYHFCKKTALVLKIVLDSQSLSHKII